MYLEISRPQRPARFVWGITPAAPWGCDHMTDGFPLRSTLARRALAVPGGKYLVGALRMLWGDARPHEQWQRIVLNRRVRELIDALTPASMSALEISGSNWPTDGYFHSHRSVDFPEFDICKDRLEERFDLIIAEQVFEHVPYPYRAARNVLAMLKPGGRFLIATPFLVKIHACPMDCSRWTETGLRHLLEDCGFPLETIRTGSWGNRRCVKANLRSRWPVYVPGLHSLRNDPEYPIQVWALAQAPS